jgi:mercury(II) reductase
MPSHDIPVELQPFDQFNQELQAQVAPADWQNPTPDGRYNLVVIGAGTAGLVAAAGAAGLGAKVGLIERHLMGGDCLNVGCVPSKALISAARVAATVREASGYGIDTAAECDVRFAEVMERVRRLRAQISPNDSAARFQQLGVDVFQGDACFTGPQTVEVAGTQLNFAKAVIATGARATRPPIPGLDKVNYLTNESLFSLTDRPERLVIVGGGPIGTEMAQAFRRLGSQVTLLEQADHILSKEDAQAAAIVQQSLQHEGVRIITGAAVSEVTESDAVKTIQYSQDGQSAKIHADALLVAIGRTPNTTGLGLEAARVEYDQRSGITVNDRLQTTNPKIYAAGDVCSQFRFTHAADFMARTVIRNALFKGRARISDLIIPRCTYTSPEVASVGLTEQQARSRDIPVQTFNVPLADVDRAILDGETQGFVKILTHSGSDRIAGATIVATNAGDMINEVTLAMKNKVGLSKIADTIHPYPTQAEAIRKAADLYNRQRLTPLVKSLFSKWLQWTR